MCKVALAGRCRSICWSGRTDRKASACDFTTMRAYTWGKQKERYETAFVESDVCGKLPIQLTAAPNQRGDIRFSFQDIGHAPAEERTYEMHQTIVRRVNDNSAGDETQTPTLITAFHSPIIGAPLSSRLG